MTDADYRQVSARAELCVGDEAPIPAWLCAIGLRRLRLCVREADAVAARDAAAEGARVAARGWTGRRNDWVGTEDLRLGPVHGSGDNAIRAVFLTAGDEWDAGREAADLPPVVVAVDHERAVQVCRSLPVLSGVEVLAVQEVRDPAAVGALLVGCAPQRAPDVETVRDTMDRLPGLRPVLFAAEVTGSERWSDLVGSGAVFFGSSGWPEPHRLAPLVAAAVENAVFRRAFRELVRPRPETDDGLPAFAWYDATFLAERRAAQETLRDLAAQAERRMPEVTATVYAYDDWAEVLLGPHPLHQPEEFAESAALGLIAFAARSGTAVLEPRVEDTVFFDPELDLVPGAGHALLAVPIRDFVGTVFGVLACHPADAHDHLRPELMRTARLLANEFAPPLATLREYDRLQGDVGADRSMFRSEAIAEQRRSESPSSILNVSERWGSWIVGGMAALLLTFAGFLMFGTATEYAEGSAVVHSRGRIPVVANEAGTVAAIRLAPGTPVAPGEVIGTLYDHAELAEVQRLEHEYEDALVRLLRDPESPTAGAGLAGLRASSEQARAALEERQLIVPVSGVLTDVRVRPGALVSPGQTVATVGAAGPGFEIVAAVPGNFRPLLVAGLPVVAELEQFPGSRFHLQAREISPEVISVTEARALMGQLMPTATEDAALALVYADLPAVLVSSTGSEYPLYDGMRGSVRIPVREERFIVTLWPGLKAGR
ncbi:MAG: HlyD family efflux transporter periplasmic adaptor subunit [Acidobacteria bacterium]|nr:HlyD family efflux transporter periplasmic adaptor subunit [Acidobacteriota bacterium]MYH22637.1 HlyD family efflux transporter periplasmic adaptor subunit [Acidobacteriota bacterium]MYK78849.1 HlyD family efflux transporter periplasmic adaptor subunit [Acidobacteriota bacterium]